MKWTNSPLLYKEECKLKKETAKSEKVQSSKYPLHAIMRVYTHVYAHTYREGWRNVITDHSWYISELRDANIVPQMSAHHVRMTPTSIICNREYTTLFQRRKTMGVCCADHTSLVRGYTRIQCRYTSTHRYDPFREHRSQSAESSKTRQSTTMQNVLVCYC